MGRLYLVSEPALEGESILTVCLVGLILNGSRMQALQSHPPSLSVVPNKVIVAKRLAQCLNPSLPSGVHQKALEVYEYVFSLVKVRRA